MLLQLLDDGRLTDGQGRTVDFKNTVVVMTSNIGSQSIMDEKLSQEEKETAVMESLRDYFRPEFVNRIDEVVVFKSLGKEQLDGIVKIQVEEVMKRLKDKEIELELDDSAVKYLADKGFDPVFGARPLKRVIQRELLNVLAKDIIAGKLNNGDHVKVAADDLHLHVEKIN